ncbi:MAG: MFS transporter [Desulfobulbaceae bacterium]|nr:MFS transporter [Desulfobulbaceae bacterium]
MTIQPLTLFRVFLPFAAGYFVSYVYRVVNAVIAPDLVADIGVGPSALGLLTATYFISFASFQLPLGVLLDRFGPRKVETVLLFFAALGAFVFARAESLTGLITGRALIGFGVSACLMAAFKAYTLWFPRDKWPLVNGFQMAAGGFGALAATSPIEATLQFTDWRGVFMGLALLTLLTAAAVFFLVPERKVEVAGESLQNQLRGIREIFTSRKFWRTAPLTTISQAAFLAIQGLWAGPWLTHVAGFERTEVARLLFWVAVAMICGFISLGSIAERLSKRNISVATTAVTCMTLFLIVQLLLILGPISWCVPLWLAFGFLGTSGIIAYSALSQSFPVHLSGRVTTAINLLVFITAFVSQWAIGVIIDFFSGSETALSSDGFTVAFLLILTLEITGVLYYILAGRKPIDDT